MAALGDRNYLLFGLKEVGKAIKIEMPYVRSPLQLFPTKVMPIVRFARE